MLDLINIDFKSITIGELREYLGEKYRKIKNENKDNENNWCFVTQLDGTTRSMTTPVRGVKSIFDIIMNDIEYMIREKINQDKYTYIYDHYITNVGSALEVISRKVPLVSLGYIYLEYGPSMAEIPVSLFGAKDVDNMTEYERYKYCLEKELGTIDWLKAEKFSIRHKGYDLYINIENHPEYYKGE